MITVTELLFPHLPTEALYFRTNRRDTLKNAAFDQLMNGDKHLHNSRIPQSKQ